MRLTFQQLIQQVKAKNLCFNCLRGDSPRWIQYHQGAKVQIHGFCDASEKGYAAVMLPNSRQGRDSAREIAGCPHQSSLH